MFKTEFENLRRTCPLIHNITNYVTVNDCANMVLACGASPIMADDAAEVEDITTICGGLNINIGTLNSRTITSMLLAGKKANQLGHPVVLDPVGAGASRLRTDTAFRLLRDVKFTVIRGNISEIKTLASGAGTTKGVDADVADKVTEANLDSAVAFAKPLQPRRVPLLPLPVPSTSWPMPKKLLHPQRQCYDEQHHRHRMPAFGPDGGVRHRQPRTSAGSRCSCSVRHGPCGRDRPQAPDPAGRQLHLPQLYHRCHLQYDPGSAGRRSKL